MKDLNSVQLIISGISGYEPGFTSLCNDYYYDSCKTEEEKLAKITNYSENVYGIILNVNELIMVFKFLETDFSCESDRHTEFNNF